MGCFFRRRIFNGETTLQYYDLDVYKRQAPAVPPEFTGGRKQKVNGKGGLLWTVRSEKSLDLSGFASPKPGRVV